MAGIAAEYSFIQYMILFGITVIFTSFSINRSTFVTHLLSAILWFIFGQATFIQHIGTLTMPLSYICLGIGFLHTFLTLQRLGEVVMERRTRKEEENWKVTL